MAPQARSTSTRAIVLQALTIGCAWWLIRGVLYRFSWTAALGGLACALVSLGVGFLFAWIRRRDPPA